MKFCSDFGSCYRDAADRSPPPSEESGSLRRRKEMVRSKSGSSSSWQPNLAAISEDVVVRPAEEDKGAKWEGGSRKRSATARRKGRSMGKSHSFSHGDDFIYRHSSMSMALPKFSAMPFMF